MDLLNSTKISVTKILKHGPRISLTYELWRIAYYELIIEKKDYEKANDYTNFIIISSLVMFSQFLMRYSTLLFDSYYKNDNGQSIKLDDINWNRPCSFSQFYAPIFFKLRFMLSITLFGTLRPMAFELITMIAPLLQFVALIAQKLFPQKDASRKMEFFINKVLLEMLLGIT